MSTTSHSLKSPVVVLSPHLDDAVFSAWHVLTSNREVDVVTVFAGLPPEGSVSPLDKASGASESASRVSERRQDDMEALALAGRVPCHLDLLDVQYRLANFPRLSEEVARQPSSFVSIVKSHEVVRMMPTELASAVDAAVQNAALIYAPAGIGGHPDHRDVARYGAHLLHLGAPVCFYADVPYLVRQGRPSWLSGILNDAADEWVDDALRVLVEDPSSLRRELVQLTPEATSLKLAASRRYTTEFEPANRDFGGALADPEIMQWEVYWVPVSTTMA